MKKISIIIPTYNSEKVIKDTVISVLNQTYNNFELIIIDDNSIDSTYEIIKKFNDKRIKIFKNDHNLGFIGNWNKALSQVNNDYFKILPDDDILEKTILEEQVKIFEKFPNLAIVGCKRIIIDENGKNLFSIGQSINTTNYSTYTEIIKATFHFGSNIIGEPGSVLIDSKVLKSIHKFDSNFIHFIDLNFYLEILSKHGDYYFINKPLYKFRVWPRSYSLSSQKTYKKEAKLFFKKLYLENNLKLLDLLLHKINFEKNFFIKRIFYLLLKIKNLLIK